MENCHEHNRRLGAPRHGGRYGIRLRLQEEDPMRTLLGEDWEKFHWFDTELERDRRLEELEGQFVYYRKGDRPRFVYDKVERRDHPGAS